MKTKQCCTCKQQKDITEFHLRSVAYRRKYSNNPYNPRCKACCVRAANEQYTRVRMSGNLHEIIRQKYLFAQSHNRRNRYHPICATVYEMCQAWNGVCHGCNDTIHLVTTKESNDKRACLDHCHATGIFRGWLCVRCNFVLGEINDDTELLERLIRYLKKVKGNK